MMRTVSKCPECGSAYEPVNSNQKYCSRLCRRRSSHDSHQKPVPCAECGEEFIRRKGKSSKFCSSNCGVNHRSRSDHACPDCGTPQTPVDTEKYGCIVRTWRCGRCSPPPEGGGSRRGSAEETQAPDVTETQIECGSTAKGHGFGCPTHHDGLNCFRCAWECTECGVPLLDWFQYEKTRPRAGEAAD